MWGRRAVLSGVVGVLLLLAGCTGGVSGSAKPAEVPPATAGELVAQSILDFGEAGAVHYKGALTSTSSEQITFDITTALTGEMSGTITVNGKPATMLVVDEKTYLKAKAGFWAELTGVRNARGRGSAIADRWVEFPTSVIGVVFGEVFIPELISEHLTDEQQDVGAEPLDQRPTTSVNGVEAIAVELAGGTVYLNKEAPHGVVKISLPELSGITGFDAEVTDASADLQQFYGDVANQAGNLGDAVDALNTIDQGQHRFGQCNARSCALVVNFTNTSKVPVRVHVSADWSGDGRPLGSCETKVGPVAPGKQSRATCVLNTPQWRAFWRTAHSVVGNHPYGAQWSALVLAQAPDLTTLNDRANAAPAEQDDSKTEGSHYVYQISYSDKVWKYAVVGSQYWEDQANGQLPTCFAVTKKVCRASLVVATDEAASAYALARQLMDEYRSKHDECPSGQWAGCPR